MYDWKERKLTEVGTAEERCGTPMRRRDHGRRAPAQGGARPEKERGSTSTRLVDPLLLFPPPLPFPSLPSFSLPSPFLLVNRHLRVDGPEHRPPVNLVERLDHRPVVRIVEAGVVCRERSGVADREGVEASLRRPGGIDAGGFGGELQV